MGEQLIKRFSGFEIPYPLYFFSSKMQWAGISLLVAVVIMSIAGTAHAYDGNETVFEGDAQEICGLEKAGLKHLPLRACHKTSCEVLRKLRGSRIVLRIIDDSVPGWSRVIPLNQWEWAIFPDKHNWPLGWVQSGYLCRMSPPSSLEDMRKFIADTRQRMDALSKSDLPQ